MGHPIIPVQPSKKQVLRLRSAKHVTAGDPEATGPSTVVMDGVIGILALAIALLISCADGEESLGQGKDRASTRAADGVVSALPPGASLEK
jgi:hypothetical protein